MTTLHDLKVSSEGLNLDTFFGLSQFYDHDFCLVCEVAPIACDHHTSSTLIGGKGTTGGPSLFPSHYA